MSAVDTMAEWGSEFDERYALLWSHGIQATAPEGSYKDRFFHYVKQQTKGRGEQADFHGDQHQYHEPDNVNIKYHLQRLAT